MQSLTFFISLAVLTFCAVQVQGAPTLQALDREERQWGLYKALHDRLPKGKHSLNFGLGEVSLGINEDGTIGLGGNVGIGGVQMGGEVAVGGSEETGLGLHSRGSASVKSDLLGLDTGVSGDYEGHIKGLSAHQKASGSAGLMLGGVGVHGGLEGASGIALENGGLATHVSAGGNAGGDVVGLGSVGAGAGAGIAAAAGIHGVSGSATGYANAGANLHVAV